MRLKDWSNQRTDTWLGSSMAAFEHAVELGVHLLEMDVYLTSDGHVMVYHDQTAERLSEQKVRPEEAKYHHFPKVPLRPTLPPHFFGVDKVGRGLH